MSHRAIAWLSAALLSACTLTPHYDRPHAPVPNQWPGDSRDTSESTASISSAVPPPAQLSADQIGWSDFFTDVRLKHLIAIALENNRNLRIATLNVTASQAQFRVQRSDLFPSIAASGSGFVEKLPPNGAIPLGGTSNTQVPLGGSGETFRYYTAGIGFTSYELDLFGRQRSLSTEAFEQYLAQDDTRRSVEISLIGEVVNDYLSVLADQALFILTQETLRSETESYQLTMAMYEADTTTLLSLRQAESAVDAARANLAQYQRQLAQDRHALTLVLGQEIPEDLPPAKAIIDEQLLSNLPGLLPSDVLTHRPDIMSAEHALRASNADIGAARAAFFPRIELTASDGTASSGLSNLFSKGTGTWSFAPAISLPIFAGGRNRANLELARVEKNIAIARYELAIQTAFREVSDALSARGTYDDELTAQEALVAADSEAYELAQLRFRQGLDSYLTTLDAQRALYAAQQGLVSLRQAALVNQVGLYKALGGGLVEHSQM
jgi:multidrug efflux system outer membrane protein